MFVQCCPKPVKKIASPQKGFESPWGCVCVLKKLFLNVCSMSPVTCKKMPHLKKGLSLLGDVLVKLPISCWPVPLGIPCISYFSNFMFWHINIYFKSDLFEIWSFYFLFCVDVCYMSISISTPTWICKTLHSISKSRPDQWPVWSRILYFKCFAEYWIHFAACLATFSLIFKNTEKSRMNLWAVTCCLE